MLQLVELQGISVLHHSGIDGKQLLGESIGDSTQC